MIVNGIYNDLIPINTSDFQIAINAIENGEYYFAVSNTSNGVATINKGLIKVN